MKKLVILLFGVGVSLVGCNQEEPINERNEIQEVTAQTESIEISSFTVYERINEDYIVLKEVVELSEIKETVKIIENADWEENIKLEMASPPNYRFKLGSSTYAIWVSPNKDSLEIVPEGQSKYIRLPVEDSAGLYQIITGQVLN